MRAMLLKMQSRRFTEQFLGKTPKDSYGWSHHKNTPVRAESYGSGATTGVPRSYERVQGFHRGEDEGHAVEDAERAVHCRHHPRQILLSCFYWVECFVLMLSLRKLAETHETSVSCEG